MGYCFISYLFGVYFPKVSNVHIIFIYWRQIQQTEADWKIQVNETKKFKATFPWKICHKTAKCLLNRNKLSLVRNILSLKVRSIQHQGIYTKNVSCWLLQSTILLISNENVDLIKWFLDIKCFLSKRFLCLSEWYFTVLS